MSELFKSGKFTLIKELHYTIEGLWFSACGGGDDTRSTTNSVSELRNIVF